MNEINNDLKFNSGIILSINILNFRITGLGKGHATVLEEHCRLATLLNISKVVIDSTVSNGITAVNKVSLGSKEINEVTNRVDIVIFATHLIGQIVQSEFVTIFGIVNHITFGNNWQVNTIHINTAYQFHLALIELIHTAQGQRIAHFNMEAIYYATVLFAISQTIHINRIRAIGNIEVAVEIAGNRSNDSGKLITGSRVFLFQPFGQSDMLHRNLRLYNRGTVTINSYA